MPGFTHEKITGNAYRILGLQADATQLQMDAALRKMQLYSDAAHIPRTPYDLPYIGPLARNVAVLRDAAARLAQPESRVHERLWWFFLVPPVDHNIPPATAHSSIEFRHAVTLLQLSRLLNSKTPKQQLDRWKSVLESLVSLSGASEFQSLQQRAEAAGDFEKRAEPYEIDDAIAGMPAGVAGILVEIADAAIPRSDFALIEKIHGMLQGIPACELAKKNLVDRLEDQLVRGCGQAIEDIDIAWRPREAEPLKKAAVYALNMCSYRFEPLLQLLMKMSGGAEGADVSRLKSPLLQLLNHISKAYDACRDYLASESVLERALVHAQGTPMRAIIENRLAQVRPLADAQRPKPVTFKFGYGEALKRNASSTSTVTTVVQGSQLTVKGQNAPPSRRTVSLKNKSTSVSRAALPFAALVAISLGATVMRVLTSPTGIPDDRRPVVPLDPASTQAFRTYGEYLKNRKVPGRLAAPLNLDPMSPPADAESKLELPPLVVPAGNGAVTSARPALSLTPSAPVTDLLLPPPPPLPAATYPASTLLEKP